MPDHPLPPIPSSTERAQVDAAMYARVFVDHHEGRLILEDLAARFYDVQVYVPGGAEGARETDRRAARREPVQFILNMLGQVNEPPADDESPSAG